MVLAPEGGHCGTVHFPELGSLALYYLGCRRRGLNSNIDRWSWLKVGKDSSEITMIYPIQFSTRSLESWTQFGAFVGAAGVVWLSLFNVLKLTLLRSPFSLHWIDVKSRSPGSLKILILFFNLCSLYLSHMNLYLPRIAEFFGSFFCSPTWLISEWYQTNKVNLVC